MLSKELVEGCEMSGFLVIHVFHERLEVWIRFDDRGRLCSVYQSGGKFTRLVNAKSAIKEIPLTFRQRRSSSHILRVSLDTWSIAFRCSRCISPMILKPTFRHRVRRSSLRK